VDVSVVVMSSSRKQQEMNMSQWEKFALKIELLAMHNKI
jgi:hypothetical protein